MALATPSGENAGISSQPPADSAQGAWRTVAILTLIYLIGTLDRSIASLLAPLIKSDLYLTDIEVSLIQGLAFGLFFMAASPVMGWLVDRHDRRIILFCGLLVWSLGALGSGLAGSFTMLFCARAVVGGFEAAINPTAYAMLGQLFPPKKLSLPMSVFVLGGNLGTGVSFLVGGAIVGWLSTSKAITIPGLAHASTWQLAFLLTALPGFLVAPLIWTAPDDRPVLQNRTVTTFPDLWAHVRRFPRFYIAHNLGFGLVMSFIVGLQTWNAVFLTRYHGWSLATTGYWMGLTQLVSAIFGLAIHGWLVDRLFGKGRDDAHMIYFAIMSLLALPFGVSAYMVDSGIASIALYSVSYLLLMSFASIGPAALQIATPPALRGKASAVYMVVISILGTILAPVIVAMLTDWLFANEAYLGRSMSLFAALTSGLAAILFLLGRAPMREVVAEVRRSAAMNG